MARLESKQPVRCDVFCRVVDNFGDVAVAWRIARILANEHGFLVHLMLDRLDVLSMLLQRAVASGVTIEQVVVQSFDAAAAVPAPLLIETFGCGLPENYLAGIQSVATKPVLINVEYLSAENWPAGVHQLSSPARGGLPERHFFFPGFESSTGGILREQGIAAQRTEMLGDDVAQRNFLRRIGVSGGMQGGTRLSWFSYAKGFSDDVFARLAHLPGTPLHVILSEGVLVEAVRQFCGAATPGTTHQEGTLQVSVIPFLAQPDYDRLLVSCHVNLVRGEDSFVRAQLAGRPMLWDIYPQDDAAHETKLAAFLRRYCSDWSRSDESMHKAISCSLICRSDDFLLQVRQYCQENARFSGHAHRWADQLDLLPELGAQLANFAQKLLK